MIALAIYEIDKGDVPPSECHIGLWGVNMAQHGIGGKSEYAAQRPSCEFWIGMARGRGIQVVIPRQSDLLHTSCLYGFDQNGVIWDKYKARKKELETRIANAEAMERRGHDESLFLRGALEATTYDQQWIHLKDEVKDESSS